jgi:hypothetical protein
MSHDPFNNDALRRALELSESPLQKLMLQMENDPVARALREYENSPTLRIAKMLEDTDFQRRVAAITQAEASFEAYSNSLQWAEVSDAIARIHNALTHSETFYALQRIDQNLKSLAFTANHVIVPLAEQIQSFSLAAAQAVQPLQDYFDRMEAWQTSLAARMAVLQTPWAIEDHLGVSVVGFARIARLHDIATGPSPFHPASGEVFEEELGGPVGFDESHTEEDRDTVRIEAGLNAEILAFPITAYPAVLFSAGFVLRVEAVAPVRTENGDQTGRFDSQHASLLGEVENRLRTLIQTELQRLEGDDWPRRRVHADIRKRWHERKTKDHDQKGDSYPLLFYADFMDLADIICERRNWDEVFHRLFSSKQDFQVSMQRLAPVRNTIGHNRPLVRSDQITLLSEGYRILNALGVRM